MEENNGGLFKNTRSTIVFIIIAVLVIAGLGLLYWANQTGKIKIFGSESQIENTYEIFFNNQATFDQYKESADNIKFISQAANPDDPNFVNGGGYFELDNIDFNLPEGSTITAQYTANPIMPEQDTAYKLTNISYAPQNVNSVKVYFQNADSNWQLYSTGQASLPTPVKIKILLETQVFGDSTVVPVLYNLKLTFTKESATTTPSSSASVLPSETVSLSPTVTPSSTLRSCFKEGESLGAVIPENADNKCCEGLVAVIPEGVIGTMGTCQKPTTTPTATTTSSETISPTLSPSTTSSPTQSCILSGKAVNKNDVESYINNVSVKIDNQEVAKTENGIFSLNLAPYLIKDTIGVKFEAEGFDIFEQTLNNPNTACLSSNSSIVWSISLNPTTPVIVPTPTPSPSSSETPTGQTDAKYTIDKMEVSKELELASGEKANFTLFENNASHSLELTALNNDSAQVQISSDPLTVTLIKNELKYVDIDNDGAKEFRLRLDSTEDQKATITYEQMLAVTFQSALWLNQKATPGSDFTVDAPGFDEGELVTIAITDPETKDVLLSQTGTVKGGKVTIKIPDNIAKGEKNLTIKSNLVPDKLVSTGINIKRSNLWLWIGLGVLLLAVFAGILLITNRKRIKNN
ncbi:MAG: hypothetical protein M1338_02270 [Patescibacteria group bacterium]|nr:hypothetical protein [Patescibacteria group bacterium]